MADDLQLQENGFWQKLTIAHYTLLIIHCQLKQPCWESNPDLRNRNPLFYPLNYRAEFILKVQR